MKISTKLRYGLRFLIYLGAHPGSTNITLKKIAEQENISTKYLEQIVTILRPLKILNSSRGNNGGYSLAKPPKKISLYDIFNSLQGDFLEMNCIEQPKTCNSSKTCPTRDLWVEMKNIYTAYLKNKSLKELVDNYKKGEKNERIHLSGL